MKRREVLITIILILALVLFAYIRLHPQKVVASQPKPTPIPQQQQFTPSRQELLSLVNQERSSHGLSPLTEDPRLDTSAQEKSDDMAINDYYSHYREGVLVGQPMTNQTGIKCGIWGENIAEDNSDTHVFTEWDNSPEHLANILNDGFTATGFGFTKTKWGYYAYTEHFCQPL